MPARGPRKDLCVVVVTMSQYSKGWAASWAATRPLQSNSAFSCCASIFRPPGSSVRRPERLLKCPKLFLLDYKPLASTLIMPLQGGKCAPSAGNGAVSTDEVPQHPAWLTCCAPCHTLAARQPSA